MSRIGNLVTNPERLKKMSTELDTLATLDPSRLTKDDLRKAAQALLDAGNDIAYLLRGELVGCPCRRIDNDDRSYLVYDEKCPHHRYLDAQIKAAKASYEAAEKKLKDELRVHLVEASLSPATQLVLTAPVGKQDRVLAVTELAVQMAEAVIAKLLA